MRYYMVVHIIYNRETLMDRLTRMIHKVFFSLTQRTVVTMIMSTLRVSENKACHEGREI